MAKMRILWGLVAALIFAFAITWLVALAPASACADDANEVLVVGVPTDRCPMIYRDAEDGAPVGIGVDLLTAAAEDAGYTVVFKEIKEGNLKEALDGAGYDVLMPFGSAIKSASGQEIVVTDNLIQTPFTLVTEEERTMPSLGGMCVGMLESQSGVADTVRDLYPGVEIKMYATTDDGVRALRTGEVNALLHNSYFWSYMLQKPAYADLQVQPATMFAMDFRVGALDTPRGREIISRLNGGIGSLSDTQRQAIVLDYTSRRLYHYDFFDYVHQYGAIALAIVSLFVMLVAIFLLRRRALRLQQKEEVRRLIDTDPLTGALSMEGFRKRVTELLKEHPDTPYLLSYNNIKNFKYINDSLGMEAGDEFLKFWVNTSKKVLGDDEAIGRVEGDKFAVLRSIAKEGQLLQDDSDVYEPLRNYFINQGLGNQVRICSGIYVLTPTDHKNIDVDRMLDFARVAEERANKAGKGGYEFYNADQWRKERRDADISSHLSVALQLGEIQVWYQPQVNFETGELVGAEALCRWKHATFGWLSPAEFIPVLEEAGLIYDLDCYVWEQVCRDLQRWNKQGRRLTVSVNVARNDVRDDKNLLEHFMSLVQRYGVDPGQLHIEITETVYMSDPELLIRTVSRLREHGFQVEMDDFGSGYSSLNMLKEMPVDRIKLDLRFLTETGDQVKGGIIVNHVVKMVRALGMDILAEGVETVDQAANLLECGCLEMQGFYFYKPMNVREFERIA
ncbi:EAL domain-containing protein [Denitrobacterium detoxificans]|jgi:EAL domain-containing protein (putative c-di-GMP-specific phosphodiesterase class I)/GGDEF domain-containing protein/ABC-type amino acid transport substrate-binding protein|uniref:EAL domain-containing protein n=1 Tax=Denitrobacterium detoxificans TaxID=79604 RepID=UPI0026F28A85|nr:EAL domain-containing protein [Denitrobacterium detoxificans]MBE6466623.1 EAL domain-containing protein [Denitrobacterium detoxificans]